MRGYSPTELDRQELAKREQAFLKNQVEKDASQGGPAKGAPAVKKEEARSTDEAKMLREIEALGSVGTTLHTGPGRDVAFEGMYVNEARALQYLEQGRMASAGTPELRNAVALESYIERKLQREFKDNPALVKRGMDAARHKIADMIRHGSDFPQPKVVDERAAQLNAKEAAKAKESERSLETAEQQHDRGKDR